MNALRLALALLLLPALARGDDAPRRAVQVAPGYVITEPSWVLTAEGKEKADAGIARMWAELEQLRTENRSLKDSVTRVSAQPGFSWSGALLLVGAGLVLGAAVAVPVAVAVRR